MNSLLLALFLAQKSLPPPSEEFSQLSSGPAAGPVGIIGARVAGLRAAMLLQAAGIPYEIIEASDRIGGRVFTYTFSGQTYDYFDVGPMRYPDIPLMQSTFELFKELG
jgi:monoamine oxidase